jgi:hypothetical protein
MEISAKQATSTTPPPIYIISGGSGASGEQVVRTVLAQFPEAEVPVITLPHLRHRAQIEQAVHQAALTGGTIVYTLVETHLHETLTGLAKRHRVVAIDLMGDLLSRLSQVLGQAPLHQPGLYRHLHRAYFERIKAIEFAVAHDDGGRAEEWPQAEIMLVGVSRVGKTPLSIYLSVLGWRVANTPLIPALPVSPLLFQLEPGRVFGLDIEAGQLVSHRQKRQKRLRVPAASAYVDPLKIYEELEAARQVFRQGGFTVIDVTDKPIEVTADEVTNLITRRFATELDKVATPL